MIGARSLFAFWAGGAGFAHSTTIPQSPGVFGGGGGATTGGGEIEPWPTRRTEREPTYDEEVFDMAMIAAIIIRKYH